MLHPGWIGGYRMVHACYMSLQTYCIIMQWHPFLGYFLKQKRCGMYVSRMQGVGKYYNMVWHSHLLFRAKVFIWRVMIGGTPLGSALKRLGLGPSTCFFCAIPLEDITHRFIKCPINMYYFGCTYRKFGRF